MKKKIIMLEEVEFYSDSEADGRYSGEFQGITLTLPVILK